MILAKLKLPLQNEARPPKQRASFRDKDERSVEIGDHGSRQAGTAEAIKQQHRAHLAVSESERTGRDFGKLLALKSEDDLIGPGGKRLVAGIRLQREGGVGRSDGVDVGAGRQNIDVGCVEEGGGVDHANAEISRSRGGVVVGEQNAAGGRGQRGAVATGAETAAQIEHGVGAPGGVSLNVFRSRTDGDIAGGCSIANASRDAFAGDQKIEAALRGQGVDQANIRAAGAAAGG